METIAGGVEPSIREIDELRGRGTLSGHGSQAAFSFWKHIA